MTPESTVLDKFWPKTMHYPIQYYIITSRTLGFFSMVAFLLIYARSICEDIYNSWKFLFSIYLFWFSFISLLIYFWYISDLFLIILGLLLIIIDSLHYHMQCSRSGSIGSISFWASRIRILPTLHKNSKKSLDFYCSVTFYLRRMTLCTLKSNKEKNWSLEGHCRKEQDPDADPDPLVRGKGSADRFLLLVGISIQVFWSDIYNYQASLQKKTTLHYIKVGAFYLSLWRSTECCESMDLLNQFFINSTLDIQTGLFLCESFYCSLVRMMRNVPNFSKNVS